MQGFSVAVFDDAETVFAPKPITEDDIFRYLKKHRDKFSDPEVYVGGWVDESDGKVYLDLSVVKSDRGEAMALASEHSQLAIFDLENTQAIDVQPRKTSESEGGLGPSAPAGRPDLARAGPQAVQRPTAQAAVGPLPRSSPLAEQSQSPEFRKWFGNSKVVDADGEPSRVFHGTDAGDMSEFRTSGPNYKGVYFSSDADYVRRFAGSGRHPGASIVPAYISIQKPFVINLDTDGTSGAIVIDNKIEGFYRDLSSEVIDTLTKRGHDGILAQYNGNKTFEIVAFSPTQIKSATGNKGTFDPNDPRITYDAASRSGLVEQFSREFAARGFQCQKIARTLAQFSRGFAQRRFPAHPLLRAAPLDNQPATCSRPARIL